MHKERTMIAIKPDGIQRGLIGEIISRFERAGMKMVGCKMLAPTKEQVRKHYYSPEWIQSVGEKTIEGYKKKGEEIDGTAKEIGERVLEGLLDYWTDRPTIMMVWQGPKSVEITRKLIGHTAPHLADVGSIRADFSMESYALADGQERALYNLVHASGSPEEAEKEIKLWFEDNETLDYELFIEKLINDKSWGKIKK